jgi:hypothetical protein
MDSIKQKITPHVISIGIFLLVASLFSMPAFKGKSIFSHDITQHKGMSKEIQDHRENFNEEPLWTNAMFGGMPAYQISVLYPGNLLKHIDRALNLGLPHPAGKIFKYLIGFYLLLLVLKVPWKFAIAGSCAFALSSYFIIILEAGHNTKAGSIGFLPPLLAGIILAYRGKYLWGAAVTALFFGLNLGSNHVQITYYMGLSLLILGAVELVKAIKDKTIPNFIKASSVVLGAVILAVGVNNTNLFLTKDYVKDTQRGQSKLQVKIDANEKAGKLAEQKRLEAIEFAKLNSDSIPFNESDYLAPKKAYSTQWSYGLNESWTLLVANFNGGGSSDANKGTDTYAATIKNLKRYKLTRKERLKYAAQSTGRSMYWGKQPGVNGPVYIGAGIIFLFLMGIFACKSHYRWWLLGTAILGLCIAWGKNFLPFFNFMYDYFPLYNKFRAVTMATTITELAVPLLGFIFLKELLLGELKEEKTLNVLKVIAGSTLLLLVFFYIFGTSMFDFSVGSVDPTLLDIVTQDRIDLFKSDILRSLFFVTVSAGVVLAIIKKSLSPQILAVILGISIVADLGTVDKRYLNEDKYVKTKNALLPFPITLASKDIKKKGEGQYRVFNVSSGRSGAINDASTAFYHHDIGGYSSVKLMIYQDLLDYSLGQEMSSIEGLVGQMKKQIGRIDPMYMSQYMAKMNVMNMLNTQFIITDTKQLAFKNPYALGNAWLVKQTECLISPDSALFGLSKTDLRSTGLLLGEGLTSKNYGGNGSISLLDYKANELSYSFNSKSEEFAIFSEVFYTGWNAYIDGELVDHVRANYVLRGLEIPAGKHEIVFKFEPSLYSSGESIALICSLLVLLLFGYTVYQEFNKSKSAPVETASE